MSGSATSGIVKQVTSGDTIVVRDVPRGGPPPEYTLLLTNISAPKLAKRPISGEEATRDQPYAWEAREFLRKKLIGESVSYFNDKQATGSKSYYSVVILGKDSPNEENVNESLVKEGLATVRAPNSPLKELEEQAKNAGKGMHNKNAKDEDHIRDVKWNVSPDQLQMLVSKHQGKPIKAVVEHVRDGSAIRCLIQDDDKTFYYLTVMLSGIRCPGYKLEDGKPGAPEPFAEEAKYFVESRLLNRDVEITLDSVSGTNVVGSVLHPKGNIAEFLLMEGFAKCLDWTMRFVKSPESFRKCERAAKEKRLRLWKDWQPTTPQLSGAEKEFQATVIEVGNGDNLIVKLPNGAPKKIFLASVRPPRPGGNEENKDAPRKAIRPLYDIPWMFEAREFLRKKLIGKKVHVVVDYIQPARENFGEKTCCTITVGGGINVAEAMVLKGLATVVKHRSDDDQRSSHYDSLTSAEMKAIKNQKGLHSKKDVPIHRIADHSADSSKAKNFLPHLKRSGRTEVLVEFVFSGSRLRLFFVKDNCLITLLLGGISCPRAPRQSPTGNMSAEGEPYGDEALQFTKEKCLQREVEVTVESVDKAGNFIGWIWVDNVNLSVALVQEGLAKVHEFSAERSGYLKPLLDAQLAAKSKKLNLWKNFVEEEKEEHKEEEDLKTERTVNHQKVVIIEVTSDLHIFSQLEDQTAKLDSMLTKLRAELSSVTIGAYTPKRGDLCAAKYSLDDQWYRAKVEKVAGNKVKVFYVDYGNRDEVISTSCAALPAGFSDPPYATEYGLAFTKLGGDLEDLELAIRELKEDLLNRSVLLNFEYKANGLPYVTLSDPDNPSIDFVKNLIEYGYLLVDERSSKRFGEVMEEYKKAQEVARKGRKALWRYGDIREDEDKEFGLGR